MRLFHFPYAIVKEKRARLVFFAVAAVFVAMAAVFALRPADSAQGSRNARRIVDTGTILNAVYEYAIDHTGNVPETIPQAPNCTGSASNEICKTGAANCTGYVDLSALTFRKGYLAAIPVDPQADSKTNGTGYAIARSVNGRITVCAPHAEHTSISASR